jgi:hypothetical protein
MAKSEKKNDKKISAKNIFAKKPKKQKSKYEEKIVVNATFEELMKELITPKP